MVGALLHANTTTDTEFLGNEANLGVAFHFDAQLADLHFGAVSPAFQIASGGLALYFTLSPPPLPSRHQR